MRRPTSLLLLMAFAYAAASGGFVYHDSAGNMSLSAQSGSFSNATSVYHFHLKGSVVAESRKQGLTINAAEVTGDAVPVEKETKIRHAVASGGTRLVKTSTGGISTLTSATADYTDRSTDALVVMSGGVRITSMVAAKKQSWVITGPAGQATLDPAGGKKGGGLRTAIIDGGARVQLDQATGGSMVATGRRMVLDNTAKPPTLTVTGSVKVQGGKGSKFGTLQNAQRAVLKLNDKGEVTSTEVSS